MNWLVNRALIPKFNYWLNRRISYRFNCRSISGFDVRFNREYALEVS